MAEVTGVREAADTLEAAILAHVPDGYDQVDPGWQGALRRECLEDLKTLVAAAERADTAEEDAASWKAQVTHNLVRAEAAEAKADTLAEVLRSIITDVDIAHDYPREVADARAALAAAEATDSTAETG